MVQWVHEEDSSFSMDKIQTSILDSKPEPDRKRSRKWRMISRA